MKSWQPYRASRPNAVKLTKFGKAIREVNNIVEDPEVTSSQLRAVATMITDKLNVTDSYWLVRHIMWKLLSEASK